MSKIVIFDGRKLRSLRERAQMSQAQLAKRVGVTQGFIWQVEGERKTPSLRVLAQIADVLNVSLEELLRVVAVDSQAPVPSPQQNGGKDDA